MEVAKHDSALCLDSSAERKPSKRSRMCFVLYLMWSLIGSSLSRIVLRLHSVVIPEPPSVSSWCWVLSLCPVAMILDAAL